MLVPTMFPGGMLVPTMFRCGMHVPTMFRCGMLVLSVPVKYACADNVPGR